MRAGFGALDQLVHARGQQQGLLVNHIALIVHLDDHVAVAAAPAPNPPCYPHRAADRFRAAQHLFLAKIEDAQDGDHAQLIGLVQDALQAGHVIGAQARRPG